MKQPSILFPGQGSQNHGMGRDLAESWDDAMQLWIRAEKSSGFPLREIYWDGDDEAMSKTEHLQPAMTAVNLSLWFKLRSSLNAAFLAGHSLGEFSALCAAEILSVDDVLSAVTLRGRLMADAGGSSAGKMAAILKLSQDAVETLVSEVKADQEGVLIIANYNSPAQFVISGKPQLVDLAADKTKELKGRAVVLPVSGAFHSPLMDEAAKEFSQALKKLTWQSPKTPVCFNVTAKPESSPEEIHALMARQMTSSVLWIQTLEYQWQQGVRSWIELGPKGVLHRLLGANFKHKDEAWQGAVIETLEHVTAFESQ